jgi:hypothetical protein
MLNASVEFVDIDPEHWLNLVRLVRGELLPASPGRERRERRKRTSLQLVWEGEDVLKALHSEKGLLADYRPATLTDPEALAQKEGVDQVIIYERGAGRRFMHRVQSRLTLVMNYVEELLVVLEELGAVMGHGFHSHPRPKIPRLLY